MLFHGEPGEVEFVADPLAPDPETGWYLKEYGGGAMVVEASPRVFGRVYQTDTQKAEVLIFVSRKLVAKS